MESGECAVEPPFPVPPRIGVLACAVLEGEIEALREEAASAGENFENIAEIQYFEVGLHDRPDQLRASLQHRLNSLETRAGPGPDMDLDAVVLAYGLCGCGTAGLQPRRLPLVIPRAHDCITIFMGSRERYAQHQRSCPGCYYYTPGWNRNRRVPGPERLETLKEEFGRQFDEEEVEFLLETEREQWALHDTALFLDLGTPDAQVEANYAQACATWLGWRFERRRGDPSLLRDLLTGRWDERFLVVRPGEKIAHSPDEAIVRAAPAPMSVDDQYDDGRRQFHKERTRG